MKKMLRYLHIYDTQGLYQRVRNILDHFCDGMHLSKDFIDYCRSKIGKSSRYLVNEEKAASFYNSEWKLMVPEGLFELTNQGGNKLV